jgi:hypothetical protein
MGKIASISVIGLQTTSKWIDHFVVECYSDVGLVNLVGTQTSSVVWDGTNNNQLDLMMFSGLQFGATYWFRYGAVTPVTFETTWSATQSLVATTGSSASVTYTFVTGTTSPSGQTLTYTLNGAPNDIDHIEAVWFYDGTTPTVDAMPLWRGALLPGTSNFQLFLPITGTSTATLWVRVINTSHTPTAWFNIGTAQAGGMDSVAEGTTYGKVKLASLTGGLVDPRLTGVIKLGSINPAWVGQMSWGASTASDGTSWITWTWSGLIVLCIDGTSISIVDNTTGYTVSGLHASTPYYFSPYISAFVNPGRISFVSHPTVGQGTDKIAMLGNSDEFNREQNQQDRIALSSGPIVITTPAAPSAGNPPSGLGGGGGGSGCPRFGQMVHEKIRGIVPIETVVPGEYLLGENGQWLRVKRADHKKCNEFIRITDHRGCAIEHDPSTQMKLDGGEIVHSYDLTMRDLIVTRNGVGRIVKIEMIFEDGWKVVIELEAPHMFLCGTNGPHILAHNTILAK